MAKLYTKTGELAGKVFELDQEIIFGRLKTCQVTIRDELLSRKHTRVYREGDAFFVEDLKSRNGTFLNGKKIQKEKIFSGDVVSLGNNEFVFEWEEENAPARSMELKGQKIKNYEIQEKFFETPLFIWYQGWQKSLDRKVALQALNATYGVHPEIREKVLECAREACRWNHPQLMEILEISFQDESIFIWVEELEGLFLKEAFQTGRMAREKIMDMALELASLLAYLHGQGVVHGSIDITSIFLNSEGITKVLAPGLSPWTLRVRLKGKHGPLLLPYTAPEVWSGKAPQVATDLYSFGVVLFRAFTGKLPFSGKSRQDLKEQHLRTPFPSLEGYMDDFPPKLDLLLQGLAAKDPEERIPAKTALQHLQEIYKAMKGPSVEEPSSARVPSSSGSERIPSKRVVVLPNQNFSKGEALLFSVFLLILFFLFSGITQLVLKILDL